MGRKKNATQVDSDAAEAQVNETQTSPPTAEANVEANANTKPLCLIAECGRVASSRGLCPKCLAAARAAVKKQRTSWTDLERLGLAAPPKKAAFGGGEAGVFSKALKNALGNE